MTSNPPIGLRFAAAILRLCRIVCSAGPIGARGRHPAIAPLVPALLPRLQRLSRRFQRLAERFAAGTLTAPKPRNPAAAVATVAPERPRQPDPLPRQDAWLLRRLMHPECEQARMDLVAFTVGLLADLATPEYQALIAAAPAQSGRLLRPLLRMTRGEAEIPDYLRLPPRKRRPRIATANPTPSLPGGNAAAAIQGHPNPLAPEAPAARPQMPEAPPLEPPPEPPETPPPGSPVQPPEHPTRASVWRLIPAFRRLWPGPNRLRARIRPPPRAGRE